MADINLPLEHLDQAKEERGFTIDYKRVLSRAVRFWYLIIISLGLAITAAYLNIRYTVKIYPVSTSIIIRETEETSGAELLYKNALIDPYRNYLNEPYIIRSYPLIESVMVDLDFGTVFYREGKFLTSELYGMPVKVKISHPSTTYGTTLLFKMLNENTFSLQTYPVDDNSKPEQFHFSDSAIFKGHHLYFQLEKNKEYRSYFGTPLVLSLGDPKWLTGSYVGRLGSLWVEEGAGVVKLSLNGSNPQKEIDFLNGLIVNYQAYDLNKKNRTADRTIKFIRSQLLHISDSLGFSESQLEQFKNKKDGVEINLEDESKRIYGKLTDLENKQSDLILRERYYNYLQDYIKRNENLDQAIIPSVMGINDQVVVQLVGKMIQLQSEIKLYIRPENNSNPAIKIKQAQIDQIRKELLEAISTMKAADKIQGEFLDSQFSNVNGKLKGLPNQQRRLVSLERNYHLLENLYIFLNQKMAEAEISTASNSSDIIVVDPPMLTGGPMTPKPTQNYIVAILVGLAIPFGLFVILDLADTKVRSKEDIDKLTGIPFIGGIGHIKDSSNLVVSTNPKSSVAESFRALRSNLSYFTGNTEKKIFMITSSIGGEGKTFTTLNLATVLALSDKKVLVIGADMRKPKLFDDFGLKNDVGLSTYLSGLGTVEQVLQHTKIAGVDLISGGPVPPNPAELLMSPIVDGFFKKALETYDYILLDTPPIGIVSDAMILTKYADHIVFVIRQNYTPKHFIKLIDEYFRAGRLAKISILLNDVSKAGPGYGYSGYGYSYGYGYGYGYGKKKDGHGYYTE